MTSAYKKPTIKSRYYDDFVASIPSQEGKTFAITGTTSGTGYVAALTLAKKGGRLLLLNRASDRANKAIESLKHACPSLDYVSIDCDLTSFDSVKKAADLILSHTPQGLDALCNNAGVMALKDVATADGYDIQMQTNHLSHFLLTKLVMPTLTLASDTRDDARIVNHSSIARFGVKRLKVEFFEKNGGNLGGNGSRMIFFPKGRWVRYSQTKLANAIFTSCLDTKLKSKNSKIKALVAHPGLALTDLQSTTILDGGMGRLSTEFLMKLGQSQEDGAIGIIKAITDQTLTSGTFVGPGSGQFAMKGPVVSFPIETSYYNADTQTLLWDYSSKAINDTFEI